MSQLLDQLLGMFPPLVFRHAPMSVAALTIAYSGAGAVGVVVEDDRLQILGADGAPSLTVPLATGLTLADVVETAASTDGLTVALADPDAGAVWALALLADTLDLETDGAPVTLARWTNPLWRMLEPIRLRLDVKAGDLDDAAAQLNLLQAAEFFAEQVWGVLTDTPRHPGEPDDAYTARQRYEILRPRENNYALADLIERDTGVRVVEVTDLRPLVFVVSGAPLWGRPLAGDYYNTSSCEVVLEGFPTVAAVLAAERNVAGGITVYVRGQQVLAHAESAFHVDGSPILSVPPPSMEIGVTAIGVGQIG